MRSFFLGLACLLFLPTLSYAVKIGATDAEVTVTESNAGVRAVGEFTHQCKVFLDPDATEPVWVLEVDAPDDGSDNCATAMTAKGGVRLSHDSGLFGWIYDARDGWHGQICAILDSGTTDQTLHVSCH